MHSPTQSGSTSEPSSVRGLDRNFQAWADLTAEGLGWVPAHGQGPHCSQGSLGEGGSSRALRGARVSVRDFLCSGASPNPLRKPSLTLSSFLRRMVFICVRDLSVFSHSPGCSPVLPQEGGLKTEECKGRQAPPDVEEEVWGGASLLRVS